MRIRIGISNYGIFGKLVEQVKPELPGDVELIAFGDVFDEQKESVQKLEAKGAVDIFVASGANAHYLRRYLEKTPIWETKATTSDILEALVSIQNYSTHAALVTYQNKIPGFSRIRSVLNMDVREVVYNDRIEELDQILDSLAAAGIEDIIGTTYVVEKAAQHNLRGHYIWSRDGLKKSLDSAEAIVRARKVLEEQVRKTNYILDYSAEGIIITDKNGIITDFNSSAERILKRSKKSMIGKSCRDVLPNTQLDTVILERTPQYNRIQNVGNIRIVTNRSPIISHNEVVGALATFFSVSTYNTVVPSILLSDSRMDHTASATFEKVYTTSDRYRALISRAMLFAKSRLPLLIEGKSGVGKSLFAECIHNAGFRSMEPFMQLSGISAFQSSAENSSSGRRGSENSGTTPELMYLAHNGTVYIDHLELFPQSAQNRLLQIISLYDSENRNARARIIVSTNVPLKQLLAEGKISDSLYYRLRILTLKLPELREHPEDIPMLAYESLTRLRPELSAQEVNRICSLPCLANYGWPGNVRELLSVISFFATVYHPGDNAQVLMMECLDSATDIPPVEVLPAPEAIPQGEQEIRDALRSAQGNQTKAAELLGISRSTLWRKIQLAGIDPREYQ